MYTTLFSVALFGSLAVSGALAEFSFHTPTEVLACQPARLSWTDGKQGWDLIVVPNDKPCDATLATIDTDDNSWHVDWTAPQSLIGQKVLFSLMDKDENEAWSETVTIGDGCKSSSAGAAASSHAASSASHTGASATTTATATGPIKGVESSAPTSSSSVGPVGAAGAGIGSSSKSNGAGTLRGAPAVVLGAIGAALAFAL